jgi:hypothetical protein
MSRATLGDLNACSPVSPLLPSFGRGEGARGEGLTQPARTVQDVSIEAGPSVFLRRWVSFSSKPSSTAQPKERIAAGVGPYITCSIGFAANRQLAKMACKAGKKSEGRYGDGNNVWHPDKMPAPLLHLSLNDIPGVGARMLQRLARAGIETMAVLLATQPKHMRALWGIVNGERCCTRCMAISRRS